MKIVFDLHRMEHDIVNAACPRCAGCQPTPGTFSTECTSPARSAQAKATTPYRRRIVQCGWRACFVHARIIAVLCGERVGLRKLNGETLSDSLRQVRIAIGHVENFVISEAP